MSARGLVRTSLRLPVGARRGRGQRGARDTHFKGGGCTESQVHRDRRVMCRGCPIRRVPPLAHDTAVLRQCGTDASLAVPQRHRPSPSRSRGDARRGGGGESRRQLATASPPPLLPLACVAPAHCRCIFTFSCVMFVVIMGSLVSLLRSITGSEGVTPAEDKAFKFLAAWALVFWTGYVLLWSAAKVRHGGTVDLRVVRGSTTVEQRLTVACLHAVPVRRIRRRRRARPRRLVTTLHGPGSPQQRQET